MGAQRRVCMNVPFVVFVNRYRLAGLGIEHASCTEAKAFNVRNVALEEPLVLHVDLNVVYEHAR